MISTLYGNLPLVVHPAPEALVTTGGRTEICKVRGMALGQHLNVQVTLDLNTGEILVMSPDNWVGSFRLGDLVISHMQQRQAIAAAEQRLLECTDARTH